MTIKQYFNTYFLDIIFKHYFDFEGKANRKTYWLFVLNTLIFCFLFGLLLGFIFIENENEKALAFISCIIGLLFFLLPELGLTVRRLHDINVNGAWAILILPSYLSIFFIGLEQDTYDLISWLLLIPQIPIFVLACKKGKDVTVDNTIKEDNKKNIDSIEHQKLEIEKLKLEIELEKMKQEKNIKGDK